MGVGLTAVLPFKQVSDNVSTLWLFAPQYAVPNRTNQLGASNFPDTAAQAVESPWSALGGPFLSSCARTGLEKGLHAM